MLSNRDRYVVIAFNQGFRVSEDGALHKGKERRQLAGLNHQGYARLTIRDTITNIRKTILTHRLAAYCFYGDDLFKKGILVRHLNGDKLDISRKNIALGTSRDNQLDRPIEDRIKHAKIAAEYRKGVSPANKKLNAEQEREIAIRHAKGEKTSKLAKEFNVSTSTIRKSTRRAIL